MTRRIVITGVSRGLGWAMVDEFIRLGHVVAGCARSQQAIDQLRESHLSPHRFDVVDVSSNDQVRRWAEAVLADGPPDLLINNAALINQPAVLWEVPADEFDRIVDVNIKGVANVIRHFVPAMVGRGEGVIVNFSSGWGRSTSPEVAPYCTTKFAIEGLSKALADELPHGMTSIPLGPGTVHTEMLETAFGDGAASSPTPQKWAKRAVPFLLNLKPADSGRSLSVS